MEFASSGSSTAVEQCRESPLFTRLDINIVFDACALGVGLQQWYTEPLTTREPHIKQEHIKNVSQNAANAKTTNVIKYEQKHHWWKCICLIHK